MLGLGVNDSGQVVGEAASDDNSSQAFLYSNGVMNGLSCPGSSLLSASAINASGQVVGSAITSDGTSYGFLYQNRNVINLGNGLSPTSINTAGQIVGYGSGSQGASSIAMGQ